MRSSINLWAFPTEWPMSRVLALARDAGFEAIEPVCGPALALSPNSTDEEVRAYRRGCLDAGLEVSSLVCGGLSQVSILSDEEEVRAQAKEHVRRVLRVGAALEVDTLLLHPGFVGPIRAGPPVVADYEVTYDRAIADFCELAVDAQEAGVVIGIENVWNKFLVSPLEMRAFVDAVNSPYVGVYFDVGNVMRTGYPQHWIRILGSRIHKVHVKDYKVNVGTLDGFVDLLRGDVDYWAVMAALREVGYDSDLVVEMSSPAGRAEHCIRQAAQDVRFILGL